MNKETWDGQPLVPGYNVDRLDIDAGLREANSIGYSSQTCGLVIAYTLSRWAKGEEEYAQNTALHYGIDLTGWYRILAAARAGGERKES